MHKSCGRVEVKKSQVGLCCSNILNQILWKVEKVNKIVEHLKDICFLNKFLGGKLREIP